MSIKIKIVYIYIYPWWIQVWNLYFQDYYFNSRNLGTPKSQFMKLIDEKVVARAQKLSIESAETADEALMACFLNSDVIVKSAHVFATVELGGSLTTGQMVVDWNGHLKKEKNVTIVTDMNQTLYENMMFKALQWNISLLYSIFDTSLEMRSTEICR